MCVRACAVCLRACACAVCLCVRSCAVCRVLVRAVCLCVRACAVCVCVLVPCASACVCRHAIRSEAYPQGIPPKSAPNAQSLLPQGGAGADCPQALPADPSRTPFTECLTQSLPASTSSPTHHLIRNSFPDPVAHSPPPTDSFRDSTTPSSPLVHCRASLPLLYTVGQVFPSCTL